MAGNFNGAKVVEIRIYENPNDPDSSNYVVSLPITVLDAVVDQETGQTLLNRLASIDASIGNHTSDGDIHVTASWKTNIAQSISSLLSHVDDDDIHVTVTQKNSWTQSATDAAEALAESSSNSGALNALDGRVTQIEESLYSGIDANPFTVDFTTLAGVEVVHGIWNETYRRLEC